MKVDFKISSLLRISSLICLICLGISATAQEKENAAALQVELPPRIYAVKGVEMSFYYGNVLLTDDSADLNFQVKCKIGKAQKSMWRYDSRRGTPGEYPLTFKVSDKSKKTVFDGEMELILSPDKPGKLKELNLLIVGDSLTAASAYPTEVARLFKKHKNPKLNMFGSQVREKEIDRKKYKVAHEGFGGWTWHRFVTKYVDDAKLKYTKKGSSPFVFKGESGPKLDISRYLKEKCDNKKPDLIVFFLGINDCFGINPTKPDDMDARFKRVFVAADKLIKAFQEACPGVSIALCLTPPANSRPGAFKHNYKNADKCGIWKQVQFQLVKRMLARFDKREDEGLFLIPVNLNIDDTDGYPDNNAVHPNGSGYKQIGTSIYCWMKWWMLSKYARKVNK